MRPIDPGGDRRGLLRRRGPKFPRLAYVIGAVVMASGAAMIPAIVSSLIYQEWSDAGNIALAMAITIGFGYVGWKVVGRPGVLTTKEGFATVGLAWFFMAFFGTLPYLLTGSITNLTDAFFETASGFTTTGASVVSDPAMLSHGILMWRSSTQWLGGHGGHRAVAGHPPRARRRRCAVGEGRVSWTGTGSPHPPIPGDRQASLVRVCPHHAGGSNPVVGGRYEPLSGHQPLFHHNVHRWVRHRSKFDRRIQQLHTMGDHLFHGGGGRLIRVALPSATQTRAVPQVDRVSHVWRSFVRRRPHHGWRVVG